MIHRSFFKVWLGLIVTISLLAVIGLFFMVGLRSSGGPHIAEGAPVPPAHYGGWFLGTRSVLCGSGLLLLLGMPLLLLVLGGVFYRRRMAGRTPCGPMKGMPHAHRGHPWPWEEEELSEDEMRRMKHWHKQHGVKAPWNEDSSEEGAQTAERSKDEPR
jgi:hypothetical protein